MEPVHFITNNWKMTINEIPLLGKEGPGRYEWNSSQIMNLPICMCSQEEKRAQDNAQSV